MATEANVTTTTDIAKVQSIDFTNQFSGGIAKLIEALGVTRKIPMASGTLVKTYKAVKDIKKEKVAEGATIPLSKVRIEPDKSYEIAFSKYRKSISAEAIQRSGFDAAVTQTDDILLREVQRDIRAKLFEFMATGKGAATASDLQSALAAAWGRVQTLFEDDGVNTIVFINPLDVAEYLGKANVTTQTVFGMTFITGFTGVTMITNTSVPQGKLYATAPNNLVLAYVPVGGGELGKAFSLTTDDTGYIGITHNTVNASLTYDTVALSGIVLFAERLDGVVVVSLERASEPPTGE